ncbi:AAA family ATPase [Thalassotalea ganghwensis]
MSHQGDLVLFCGKMGAGKSTNAKSVALNRNAVLISEDEWLAMLYPEQIHSFDDYLQFSARLKPLVKSHIINILATGTTVVMDFPANTKKQREWFNMLAIQAKVKAELIYLNVSNEVCLMQLAKRRIAQPQRAKFDNEEMFNFVTKYFEAPVCDEFANIQVIEKRL